MGVAYMSGRLSNTHCTVTLSSAQARSYQKSNAYFEGISVERIPCGSCSLALRFCPLTLLQSECENSVACPFLLKYLREHLRICEIREIKAPQKFSAKWYMLIYMVADLRL